jgi:hypothetical protein
VNARSIQTDTPNETNPNPKRTDKGTMTTETITTETIKPSDQASRTFIRAKQAKTEAGKAYDEARQTVIDAFAHDGVEVA